MKDILQKEGDLYATVTVGGHTFDLRYGYYADTDRGTPPDVIYPDLAKEPCYTDGGERLVTLMQDACPLYAGRAPLCEDSTCADCRYLRREAEYFGICRHTANKR